MALIDDFKARFPEFTDAVVDVWIPILEPVYPAYYGLAYVAATQEATLNLLAHLISLEPGTGLKSAKGSASSQIVASKSVGSVSVSHAAATQSGGAMYDYYNATKYGQRFLMLTARRYGGMAV